jgi:hypothetical protein
VPLNVYVADMTMKINIHQKYRRNAPAQNVAVIVYEELKVNDK